MKATRFFAALLCGLAMSLSFSSCGTEDESSVMGYGKFSIEGASTPLSFAFWRYYESDMYQIHLANFDERLYLKTGESDLLPDRLSTISIWFKFKKTDLGVVTRRDELPTGDFWVDKGGRNVGYINQMDPNSYSAIMIHDNSIISITKNVDTYNIVIDPCYYTKHFDNGLTSDILTTSLTYTGLIPPYNED